MVNKNIYKFLLIALIAASADAQPLPREQNLNFHYWILDSNEDTVSVAFAYAIPYTRLVFTKIANASGDRSISENLGCVLSFSVDVTDSATGTNYHENDRRKITVNNFAATQDSKSIAEGALVFKLPSSVYRISAEVRDENQQISYLTETETTRLVISASFGSLESFCADSSSGNTLYPDIDRDVAIFPFPIYFGLLVSDTATETILLKLKTGSGSVIREDTAAPKKVVLTTFDTAGRVSFRFAPNSSHSFYSIKYAIDSLPEGDYVIEAQLRGKTEKFHLEYSWIDKPLTLRDFKKALALLRYLVPDSIFSDINSGSDQEKEEKFRMFWKAHDPTPKTAFNELEAEYYERADYAVDHFGTISASDGRETDRGKEYMLFGKPASVRREFEPDGTYEILGLSNSREESGV